MHYLLLAGGGLTLLLAVLGLASFRETSQRDVRALTPTDISQAVSGIFNTGNASAIAAIAGPPDQVLVGGTTRTAGSFVPKLISLAGNTAINLSFVLKNFTGAAIESIAYDGQTWLIGGGDPYKNPAGQPKLNAYDGSSFIDLSSLVQNHKGSVQALSGNGSYWLVGINGLPAAQGGALEAAVGETSTVLLKYDGATVSEIVSSVMKPDLNGAWVQDILWNGEYWLIAFESVPRSESSNFRGPYKSRLMRYDGATLTELTVGKLTNYAVFSIGWNENRWLIPVYENITGQTTFWSYGGNEVTQLATSFPDNTVVSAIAWTGDKWLIATTTINNLRTGITRDLTKAHDLSPDAGTLWEYDGASFKRIELPTAMMLIGDIAFNTPINTAHLGGVNSQGRVGLFTLAIPQAPKFPDGTLLRSENRPEIFSIFQNKKKHVPDAHIFASYGYRFEDVQTVDEATLRLIPDVKLISAVGDPRVFYLDKGQKRWLRNEPVFASYGLPWDEIVPVNTADLAVYREARLLKFAGNERVYFVTGKGLMHHIPTAESFVSYGNQWEDIVEVSVAELQSYEVANLVRKIGDFRVYKVQDGIKYWVQTQEAFKKFGLDPNKILEINDVEFNSYSEGTPLS